MKRLLPVLSVLSERTVFDLDGNQTNVVTSTGEWAVEYNGENRPVRWTRASDGATVLMAYDRMGRRIRKNGETFIYDGYLNVSRTVWDPTEPVATRPLVWRGEDGNAFYCHDANKNVSDVVDATFGETAAYYDYAPFGALRLTAGVCAADNPLRFSSEFADDTLGLTYYNHRHYWPAMGRWIQRDALLGHLQEPGLYLFCQNQVAWVTDYLGLDVIKPNSDGSCPTKCYNGRNVQLEAIWLCTRKLGGVGPTAVPLLNHQYVCCGGGNSECYGVQKFRPSCMKGCDRIKDPKTRKLCKETCYARKGSIIEKEVSATGTCEKRCVSPSEKDSACSGSAKMPEDYAIGPFGVDCQEWAEDATSSKCE